MKTGFTHESTFNESKEWYTPRYIFKALGISFDLDPCSPGQDIVPWVPAQIHHTYLDDGLNTEWFGKVWMNPPYGMDTPKWMEKLKEHNNGIALVFSRTDTQWFHDYVPTAGAICFIKGRVQFVKSEDALYYADGQRNPKGGCGAGSMLIGYGDWCSHAVLTCNLGLALPVSRYTETFRTSRDFAGGGQCPNENPPRVIEPVQGSLFKKEGKK